MGNLRVQGVVERVRFMIILRRSGGTNLYRYGVILCIFTIVNGESIASTVGLK